MNKGKDICNELKALRRRIAEENGIPLETEECTYRGECCGTCPRCDAEVRYLEDALSRRLRMGKAAMVAGVALGLAVSTGVKAQNVADTITLKPLATEIPDTVGKVRVTGVVLNAKTKQPEPFVNVTVNKDGKMIGGAATDMEGRYSMFLNPGEYELKTMSLGYKDVLKQLKIEDVKSVVEIDDVFIEYDPTRIITPGVVVTGRKYPLIDKNPYGSTQTIEYDGVKVIAK